MDRSNADRLRCAWRIAGTMIVALWLGVGEARAYTFDDVLVEYWAGSGANEAMMVVDFGAASYAFGYRWDGAAVSWDMMQAIADEQPFDMDFTEFSFGIGINALYYGEHAIVSDWDNSFAGYWSSSDGEDWLDQNVGVSDRVLAHGDWDGWSYEPIDYERDDPFQPRFAPVTPIPEPAAVVMLGMGAAGLLLRRRQR